MCWAHVARNYEGLVPRGGDGTHIGVWARSLYRSLFADRSAFVEDRTSLRTYQVRTRRMQSGFGELLTQGTLSDCIWRVRRWQVRRDVQSSTKADRSAKRDR